MQTIKGYVSGRVQGVGFRYFVRQQAERRAVVGYAKNLADGRVEFLLQGEDAAVLSMLEAIRQGPVYSQVSEVETETVEFNQRLDGFRIE